MDKALSMGQDSASGGFMLLVGKILSTVMLAFGTILLGMFIREGEYGIYSIAIIPVATLLIFQDWGVSSAMTKYCAECRARTNKGELWEIIKTGLAFEIAIGIILTLISLLMANIIATTIFRQPETGFFISIISATILSSALLTGAQSIFVGFEKMKFISFVVISQAVVQSILSPLLVYLGYGIIGAILGYTISSITAGIIAAVLLYLFVIRKLPPSRSPKIGMSSILKKLLRFGVPLAIATMLAALTLQVYSFVMASFLDEVVIGNYRLALNFAAFLSFFSVPIATVLFPAFSKLDLQKEPQLVKSIFSSSIKYASVFLVPAAIGVMVLSGPLVSTLFGDKWLYAPFFLSLAVIESLEVVFGNLTINSFLPAIGETRMPMKMALLNLAIAIPLSILLIPAFGIPGLILANTLDYIPSTIIYTLWLRKHYQLLADFRSSAKILVASIIAGVLTYSFLTVFVTTAWIALTIGTALFLIIYLVTASLIRAVNQTDITNLRVIFSILGPASLIVEIPLRIMDKLAAMKK